MNVLFFFFFLFHFQHIAIKLLDQNFALFCFKAQKACSKSIAQLPTWWREIETFSCSNVLALSLLHQMENEFLIASSNFVLNQSSVAQAIFTGSPRGACGPFAKPQSERPQWQWAKKRWCITTNPTSKNASCITVTQKRQQSVLELTGCSLWWIPTMTMHFGHLSEWRQRWTHLMQRKNANEEEMGCARVLSTWHNVTQTQISLSFLHPNADRVSP